MKKKSNRFALLVATAILVIAIVAVAFVGYQFVNQWLTLRELNAEKAALTTQLNSVNGQNDTLKKEIQDSSTDSAIERLARELLGWVKPGEIKIVDKDK